MKNLKKAALFLAVLLILPLVGCWDRRELEDLFLPYTIGIDVDEQNPRLVTVTISGPTIEEKAKKPLVILSTQGESIMDARDNLQRKLYRYVAFGHAQVILFGEKTAKRGISVFLDAFLRDPDIKGSVNLAVVKGKAGDFMQKANLTQNPYLGILLKGIIQNGKVRNITPVMTLADFYHRINTDAQCPTVPYVILAPDKDEIRLSNTAIFHHDHMVGIFPDDESMGEMILSDNFGSSLITIGLPSMNRDKFHDTLTIRVLRGRTKITPEVRGGNVSITLDVRVTGEIAEHTSFYRTITNTSIQRQNRYAERELTKTLKKTIKKMQYYKVDTAGFGKKVRVKYPRFFNEIKWGEVLSKAKFNVKVKVNLKRPGTAA